jgi:hypothetical protein
MNFFQRGLSILRGHLFTIGAERTDFDCIVCREPCDPSIGGRAGTFSHQEGGLPKLYSHGMCMAGYSGPQLRALYLREVAVRFQMGRAPLMLAR